VIIDIFSRYVPGWMLAHAENARLARALLAETATKQGITCGQLAIMPTVSMWGPVLLGFLTRTAMDA